MLSVFQLIDLLGFDRLIQWLEDIRATGYRNPDFLDDKVGDGILAVVPPAALSGRVGQFSISLVLL